MFIQLKVMFIHITPVCISYLNLIAKFPVYWSTATLGKFIQEAMGPEPVSPHYESFVRSRRAVFGVAGLLYGIFILEQLNLNSMYGQHGIYQLYTLLSFSILTFEIRYISQKLPA